MLKELPPRFLAGILIVFLLVGCARDNDDNIQFIESPQLRLISAYPAAPLHSISYKTDKPATVELLLDGSVLVADNQVRAGKKNHQLNVTGVGSINSDLRLRITTASGASALSKPLPIPVDARSLVPFELVSSGRVAPLHRENHYVVTSIYRETEVGVEALVVAFDQTGRLHWMLPTDFVVTGIAQTASDTLTLSSKSGLMRVNTFGQPLGYISGALQPQVDTNVSFKLSSAYIGSSVERYKDQSALIIEPEWQEIVGDSNKLSKLVGSNILAIADSGVIKRRWSIFNLLDPERKAEASERYSSTHYSNIGAQAWAAFNVFKYVPKRKEIAAEAALQGVVFGFGETDADLKWLIGDSVSWAKPWQQLFLKLSEKGGDVINPVLYGVFPNGDILLASSSPAQLGRYRVNDHAKLLESVLVYSAPEDIVPLKRMAGVDVLPLAGNQNQLLVVNKANAEISILSERSGVEPWVDIAPLAGQAQWRISAIELGADMSAPAQPAADVVVNEGVAEAEALVDKTALLVGADPRGEPIDMAGHWELVIDSDVAPRKNKLILSQTGHSASGTFSGRPIAALIKGNVISFSLRNRADGKRVLQRFRAVISESENSLKGYVDISIDGKEVAASVWLANRITTYLP